MIKLASVTKSFPGRDDKPVEALHEVDLEIKTGEFLAVVGPSGSGKSTLLFTIGAMLKSTEGTVMFGDTDIYSLSPAKRAALRLTRIGFVFQTFNLIPYLSCLENVSLPAILARKSRDSITQRAREMLERLGMGDRLSHRPAELSVGERQRVAICRSLINDPEVILADEPTGNLDPGITEEVMCILLDLNSTGQTIIMATHNRELAGRSTRVITLNRGRLEPERPSPNQEPEE